MPPIPSGHTRSAATLLSCGCTSASSGGHHHSSLHLSGSSSALPSSWVPSTWLGCTPAPLVLSPFCSSDSGISLLVFCFLSLLDSPSGVSSASLPRVRPIPLVLWRHGVGGAVYLPGMAAICFPSGLRPDFGCRKVDPSLGVQVWFGNQGRLPHRDTMDFSNNVEGLDW